MDNPVLLFLDNHESHVWVECSAKQNIVIMLSFPLHCSHKLQPLDRSVYGPLKCYNNAIVTADCFNSNNMSLML